MRQRGGGGRREQWKCSILYSFLFLTLLSLFPNVRGGEPLRLNQRVDLETGLMPGQSCV